MHTLSKYIHAHILAQCFGYICLWHRSTHSLINTQFAFLIGNSGIGRFIYVLLPLLGHATQSKPICDLLRKTYIFEQIMFFSYARV